VPIVADVKDLRLHGEEEFNVAGDADGNVSFSGGWEAAHDDDELFRGGAVAPDDFEGGGIFAFGYDVRGGIVVCGGSHI